MRKMEYFAEVTSATIRSSSSHNDLNSTKESPVDQFPDFESYLGPFRQRGSTVPSSMYRGRYTCSSTGSGLTALASVKKDEEFEPSEFYRVRSFSVTGKGVKKCGETLRMRLTSGQHSTGSVSSTGSVGSSSTISRLRSWSHGSSSSERSLQSSGSEMTGSSTGSTHWVAVLGSPEVGKRSLVSQFVTFDWDGSAAAQDLNVEDLNEIAVSVLLDGEESEMRFINLDSSSDVSPGEFEFHDDLDAFVIVYSVSDRSSFNTALRLLARLHAAELVHEKAVILVGNKIDLERSRIISTEEGREAATSYGCKFIETSEWISHNVDELLVGILSQIRLKLHQRSEVKTTAFQSRRDKCHSSLLRNSGSEKKNGSRRSRSVVRDLFRKMNFNSKSCGNLHVL